MLRPSPNHGTQWLPNDDELIISRPLLLTKEIGVVSGLGEDWGQCVCYDLNLDAVLVGYIYLSQMESADGQGY